DLAFSMPGAYRGNPDKDPNGDDLPPYVAAPGGHFKGALITHNGDITGGDGLQDLVVRIGGRLWVYPGDGYGAVNIDKRQEVLLPDNAPSPASFTQIVAAGDITGDGRTDFLATVNNGTDDELWAFIGYHGVTVDQAIRLVGSGWQNRDIVTVQDVSGDSVADLIFRSDATGRLLLRKGVAASSGGVDPNSLALAANSSGGSDSEYAASGWAHSSVPFLVGIPDANGDSIPDIWAVRSTGAVHFHAGSRTAITGNGRQVYGPRDFWVKRIAIG
ncbi:VCBS repeat-containing protein, partial [Streptomyces sp. CC219B]|uniref:VCBS repeat-containing protein n=1 Tax=Streptomyces sp. CC219B TaxID=3044574 RepID=UPI0024A9717A